MEPIHLTIDTHKAIRRNEEIFVTQYDSEATFVVKLQQDGKDIPLPENAVYSLAHLRSDNVSVITPNLGKITGENELTFILGIKEISVIGMVRASIQMVNVDGRLSTLPFNYYVVRDLSSSIPMGEEKSLIEVVLGEGPAVINEAKKSSERAEQASNKIDQSIISVTQLVQSGTVLYEEIETLKESSQKAIDDTLAVKEATEKLKKDTEIVKQATEQLRDGIRNELDVIKTQIAEIDGNIDGGIFGEARNGTIIDGGTF